ncbi:MAG: porin family protein [Campylobacterales bacterium]|nr:porin family protein [Campylobacterales bacterium]
MKKIVLASLLATGLMAAGNENYVGISYGKVKSDFSVTTNPGYVWVGGDTDFTDSAYNLTLGHYYGENGRVSATFTYVDGDDATDRSNGLTFSYDFILPLADNKLAIFVGPSVGYTWLKYDDGSNFSGIHYGAQAGAIVRLIENIEIEGGYRYLFENGEETYAGGKIDLDNVSMWYVGANFRF